MKFKVGRKILGDMLKRFVSKGKLTLLDKEEMRLKTVLLKTAGDAGILLYSVDTNTVIFGKCFIPGVIEEEGEVLVGNIESVLTTVKSMKGNDVEFDINDHDFILSDGKKKINFGIDIGLLKTELSQWYENTEYDDGVVKFKHPTKENLSYQYIKWFDLEDGGVLGDLEDNAIKVVRSDVVTFTTDEGMMVSCKNSQMNRSYDEKFDADVESFIKMNVANIFPVTNNLSGKAEFFYYVTKSNGALRVHIHNGAIDWMVRCPAQVNAEND